MVDIMATQQQIIGDDPTMAPPPDGFRTHQGQSPVATEADNIIERCGKYFAYRIIGVVMETLYPPQRIEIWIDAGLFGTSAAQLRKVPIANLNSRKLESQIIAVEGRIVS